MKKENVEEFITWLEGYLDEALSEEPTEEYTEAECLKKASEWLAVASDLVDTKDEDSLEDCLERVSDWLEKASKIAMKKIK